MFFLSQVLRCLISNSSIIHFSSCRYEIDSLLTEEEKTYVLIALWFHPRKREKIGTGIVNIKVKQIQISIMWASFVSWKDSIFTGNNILFLLL